MCTSFCSARSRETKAVVPEKPRNVTVKGRVLDFPNNTGIDGGTLRIYLLDAQTGQRAREQPVYEKALDETRQLRPLRRERPPPLRVRDLPAG